MTPVLKALNKAVAYIDFCPPATTPEQQQAWDEYEAALQEVFMDGLLVGGDEAISCWNTRADSYEPSDPRADYEKGET